MAGPALALVNNRSFETPANHSSALGLVSIIKAAQARAPGLTLTQLLVFLTVGAEEGIRLNDLGERINESQATVSRSVGALTSSGYAGSGRAGHGLLVLMRDRDDGRGRRAALSETGKLLYAWIQSAASLN